MTERSSTTADVYKASVLAATLMRTHAGVAFKYRSEYLASGFPPVASSLPLRADAITLPGGAVPPFFAGLLPEGHRLTALRRAIKTSADDELSLLIAVGSDTIGDVQVMPAGEPPDPHQRCSRFPRTSWTSASRKHSRGPRSSIASACLACKRRSRVA